MFRKIISSITALALICGGVSASAMAAAAGFSLSLKNIGFEDQERQGKNLPPPEEMPVNDSIKDLSYRKIKIMIDPGHFSYYNQSPVYSPYWESVMTWKLSNYLQKELQALGAHADLTKSSLDEDPSLNDRGFLSKGYDLFLSVHSNAENGTYSDAPMAFVYQELPWTTIDDVSADVGKLLADTTASVMGTRQKGTIERRKGTEDHDGNGIMDDEWYSVLFGSRYVGTPGILMEHSFHTNYRSSVWLYNDDNLKKLAKAEAKVIYDYFKAKKDREQPPESIGERLESNPGSINPKPVYESPADNVPVYSGFDKNNVNGKAVIEIPQGITAHAEISLNAPDGAVYPYYINDLTGGQSYEFELEGQAVSGENTPGYEVKLTFKAAGGNHSWSLEDSLVIPDGKEAPDSFTTVTYQIGADDQLPEAEAELKNVSEEGTEQLREYVLHMGLIKGDMNYDGMITPSDATIALREYTLLSSEKDGELTELQRKSADVDGDGILTGSDVTMILRYATLLASDINPSWEELR